MAPSRDVTTARPSVQYQARNDNDMTETLQRQISQGSPSACLAVGDMTFAAAIQRNRSLSSSSRSSSPRSSSTDNDSSSASCSLFARAASMYITGIILAFSSSSPVLARRHSPTASTSVGLAKPTTHVVGSPGLSAQPTTRDYALICNLVRNLTFVLQKAPFHRRRHHLYDASLILPEMQSGTAHQATIHETLGVLGWTAPTTPPSEDVVAIPTIAYRLSKQFLPALLHAEDELLSASYNVVRGQVDDDIASKNGALLSLLGDLSSAAAMAHNARGHSSSSSITGSDSAAEESNSSYPASPEQRLRRLDLSRDEDDDSNEEEILNDSPPTTPSQTSSSDDLSSKACTDQSLTHQHHHVAFQTILRERLGGIDASCAHGGGGKSTVGFPRSNTIDTISSGVSSPVSRRSRASSIRSTASSFFERMCGQPKAKTTVSLHAEPQSTMGSFTPVSAKTASTSLRRFGVPSPTGGKTTMWGARMKSRLGMPTEWWSEDSDGEAPGGGAESDSAAPPSATSRPIARRHARSATCMDVPAISMTHASFRPESMLDVVVAGAKSATVAAATFPKTPAPSPVSPPTRARPQVPSVKPRTTRTISKPSPPIPSISSVLAARPKVPSRSNTDPTSTSISGPARGLPKLDPTLAALEKGCRLKAKVSCAQCGKVGWDFPKNRQGQALCSRDCRVAFKAVGDAKMNVGGVVGVVGA